MDIDVAELARAVGHEVPSYTVTAIDPELRLHSVTGGVYRVAGDGFSLVMKVVRRGDDPDPGALWVSGEEESHRNYWKREWLAFDSRLLAALPGQLRAPRLHLATEHRTTEHPATEHPTECRLWMEDVKGRRGDSWDLTDYDSAAFDLGSTQGCYPAGSLPQPEAPWLARNWLREWVAVAGRRTAGVPGDGWADPRVRPLQGLRNRADRVWEQREALLSIVERAPQTLVHGDLWPTNLIAADDGTTVAIDWSQVGIGAVGQDLDQLTLDPVWMQVRPGESLEELEAHVLPGYLAGLQHAGLPVTAGQLRLWYASAAAVHYLPMMGGPAATAADPAAVEAQERRWSRPFEDLVADRSRVVERAIELGEWALESAP